MSNNHPNDNIYSILGKLAALKPTPEEKRFALVKEIRESVEAQGSITEGVNSVETKLRKQLAESKLDELSPATLGSYAKKSSADAAKRQGKVTGTNQFHKGSEFAVKAFYGDTIQSRPDRTDPKIAQRQAGVGKAVDRLTKECTMCEAGDCNEHGVREAKGVDPLRKKYGNVINKCFGKIYDYGDEGLNYLDDSAPTWFDLFSDDQYDGDIETIIAQAPIDLLKVSAKELINVVDDLNGGVFEGADDLRSSVLSVLQHIYAGASAGEEMIDHVADELGQYFKQVKQCNDKSLRKAYQLMRREGAEAEENPAMMAQVAKQAIDLLSQPGIAEGEVKKIPGGVRHTKTDYPGYPTDDTLDNLDNLKGPGGGVRKGRPLKAQTKNPRRDPNAPKKGRGRPATAKSGPVSMPSDPFGRVTGRVPKGRKGTVHTVDEAMRLVARNLMVMEGMNFKRMMEEQHMSLAEMVECMTADLKVFKETGVCSDSLRDMMEVYGHAKRQADEGIEQPQHGGIGDVMSPQDKADKMARLTPNKPGVMGSLKSIGQGMKAFVQGKPEPIDEEQLALEAELNELAKLAGLSTEGNAFTGKLKDTPKGGKFDLDGKEYTDTSTLDEGHCPTCDCKPCECNEGNAFGKAVRDAKADGVQPGEKVKVDGKEYPVKEAQELVAMLKVAGINTDQLDEAIKSVTEGSMKRWLEDLATKLDKDDFVSNADEYGMTPEEAAEWWNNCNGVEYSDKYSPRNGPDDNDNDYDYYNRLDSELDETDLANAPDEKYDTIDATMRPGDADSTGAHRNFGGEGDNLMAQPPNVPAKPVRSVKEAILALESELAAEYESIKKASK